jgi:hypothetical protein
MKILTSTALFAIALLCSGRPEPSGVAILEVDTDRRMDRIDAKIDLPRRPTQSLGAVNSGVTRGNRGGSEI